MQGEVRSILFKQRDSDDGGGGGGGCGDDDDDDDSGSSFQVAARPLTMNNDVIFLVGRDNYSDVLHSCLE